MPDYRIRIDKVDDDQRILGPDAKQMIASGCGVGERLAVAP